MNYQEQIEANVIKGTTKQKKERSVVGKGFYHKDVNKWTWFRLIFDGNIFDSQAEALVNPVNLDGIMGKGLALEFKKMYPEMFKEYRSWCKSGDIEMGDLNVWVNPGANPKYIINFPTKVHYYNKSLYDDIGLGLFNLTTVTMPYYGIKSVAIPPLGCGLGGLDWNMVKGMIVDAFFDIPDTTIELYEPKEDNGPDRRA